VNIAQKVLTVFTLMLCIESLAHTTIHNYLSMPIKIRCSYLICQDEESDEIAPGEVAVIEDWCCPISKIKLWVKEPYMTNFAQDPTVIKNVYLGPCFKEIFIQSKTDVSTGQNIYMIHYK
jgi:hypothetical protein